LHVLPAPLLPFVCVANIIPGDMGFKLILSVGLMVSADYYSEFNPIRLIPYGEYFGALLRKFSISWDHEDILFKKVYCFA
jgi:hypothetical protein